MKKQSYTQNYLIMQRWFKRLISMFLLLGVSLTAYSQNAVTGTVTDENGDGLPGANILIQGTSSGTVTDKNGKFSIQASSNQTLIISFIGYQTKSFEVGNQKVFEISLEPDAAQLEEIVVLGYGQTQNKQTVSTAVAVVSSKTIENISAGRGRPEMLLQGTTPGVVVQQTSGSPGAAMTVRLRGVSTAGGAQPLYLVDGLQVPNLNYLNSADIESMNILKDAASSAIYGARGANGVVLVTTKKGKRNTGPQLSFEGYTGVQNLANKPDLMNKDQFVDYYNEYQTANNLATLTDADRAALPNTDWYDEVFEKNAPIKNYNMSLSQGGENFSYYVSAGLFDQNGMVGGESGKSQYTRKNITASMEFNPVDNLKIQLGGNLVSGERNYLFENSAGTGTALMNYINSIPAVYPAFVDGTDIPFHMGDLNNPVVVNGVTLPAVGAVLNPHAALKLNNNRTTSDIYVFNFATTWTPIENLDLTTTYARYEDRSFDKRFTPEFDFRPESGIFNTTADLTETDFYSAYSQWEGNAKYKFTNLTDQHLEVLAGFSVLESEGSTYQRIGSDFLANTFDEINFALIKDATTITNVKPSAFETGLLSFYGRVSYDYKEKYLFSATVRSDASSKFGSSNRRGFFPSISAGWVISEESFLSESSTVDLFKLRASWGINGNDNIGDYNYSTVVNPNSNPIFGGANITGISRAFLSNPNVKWEEVSQTNIGIDLNLFNNKFGVTLDYYTKKTTDMLVPVGTPLYIGLPSAAANIADVKNSGIELLLTYRKNFESGLSLNLTGNFAKNDNEVTSLGSNGQPLSGGNIGFIFTEPITRTDVGKPISSFYGLQVQEIDANGDFVFRDLNGDDAITNEDKTTIGSPFPDFTYGFNIGLEYKGFDFNAFFYGSKGNDIYDATVRLDATTSNRPVSYIGDGAPRNILNVGATSGAPDQVAVSDFYVKDGSFTKLKNITLGYSLPQTMVGKIKLSKLRVYVAAQNLFTITNYDGVDPEIGEAFGGTSLDVGIDRGFYPQPRTIMFGFQAKF